jgi:hypothetical protein
VQSIARTVRGVEATAARPPRSCERPQVTSKLPNGEFLLRAKKRHCHASLGMLWLHLTGLGTIIARNFQIAIYGCITSAQIVLYKSIPRLSNALFMLRALVLVQIASGHQPRNSRITATERLKGRLALNKLTSFSLDKRNFRNDLP